MFKTYKKLFKTSLIFCLSIGGFLSSTAQNNALVLNGAVVKLNNGTFASPIYLVVNNGSNQAIKRNSGHIISESEGNYVRWMTSNVAVATSFVFPFGFSTTDYIPVYFNKTPVGVVNNASAVTVSTWATNAANLAWANTVTNMVGLAGANATNSAIDRNWQIMTASNVTATTNLYYRGVENTTLYAVGPFSGQEWNVSNSDWMTPTGTGVGVTGAGTIGNSTGITVVPYGISTSSPYILSATSAPLPIELVSFSAYCESNQTHVKWTNASETNVWNMELQKSLDMNIWSTIYIAQPSNTNSTTNYNYVYPETSNSSVYYRLKTNNNDGSSDVSAIIVNQSCASDIASNNLSAFYYNNLLNVSSQFENDATVNYSLYDVQGKRILSGQYMAGKGEQLVSLPINDLSDGVYIFNAESNATFYNRKIIIAR